MTAVLLLCDYLAECHQAELEKKEREVSNNTTTCIPTRVGHLNVSFPIDSCLPQIYIQTMIIL